MDAAAGVDDDVLLSSSDPQAARPEAAIAVVVRMAANRRCFFMRMRSYHFGVKSPLSDTSYMSVCYMGNAPDAARHVDRPP